LISNESLLPGIGGVRLRMTLDNGLWSERDHVTVDELCEWFPRYLYLPRVSDRNTIVDAVRDGGLSTTPEDTFALAEDFDEAAGRYLGLRLGQGAPSVIDNSICLVKVDVARKQLQEDQPVDEQSPGSPPSVPGDTSGPQDPEEPGGDDPITPESKKYSRFFGSVRLDGSRVGRDAGRIADEVLSHLAALPNAQLNVTLEVQVEVRDGVSEDVVRTVSENANALKFDQAAFEKD